MITQLSYAALIVSNLIFLSEIIFQDEFQQSTEKSVEVKENTIYQKVQIPLKKRNKKCATFFSLI